MDNYYSALSVFSWNIGHPQPIVIAITKKCPKLPKIHSTEFKDLVLLEACEGDDSDLGINWVFNNNPLSFRLHDKKGGNKTKGKKV